MISLYETIINSDNSVSTEDRFLIRKFLEDFIEQIAKKEFDKCAQGLDESFVAEGFYDYPVFKKVFLSRLINRAKLPNAFIRLPQLKVFHVKKIFKLHGTYEEYSENVLVTEGSVDLVLMKFEKTFKILKIVFYPRMLLKDSDEE